jgi:glucose-6-phosphate-specific signal transduction histidine kinase
MKVCSNENYWIMIFIPNFSVLLVLLTEQKCLDSRLVILYSTLPMLNNLFNSNWSKRNKRFASLVYTHTFRLKHRTFITR